MDASTSPTVWFVGAGRLRLRIPLMKQLVERGFQVGAVGPEEAPEFEEHGFPYYRYPLRRAFSPWGDRQAFNRLCELFDEHRPDVVHAVNTKPSLLVPYAARKVGLPASIRTITGLGAVYSSASPLTLALRPVYKTLQRRSSKVAAATVFQNSDDREFFRQHNIVPADRDELVLSSGIDVEEYRNQRRDFQVQEELKRELGLHGKRVITMVTRMIKSKGVMEYLNAASKIRQENDVVFLLIGSAVHEGPDAISAAELKQHESNVRILGSRTDIADILGLSDLFALPSYFREGIPRVLLEAGAMSLPLITTDWPGCREVVDHNYNGMLIPPKDADALASSVSQLLEQPELRYKMGQRSRKLVTERFHLNTVADQYEAIYRRVLGESLSLSISRRAA